MPNEGKLVAGAAGGALLAYLLTSARQAKASPPPAGIDQKTWDLWIALLEVTANQSRSIDELVANISDLTTTVNNLTSRLGGQTTGPDPFASARTFTTGQVICLVALTAYQLPPIPVPQNKQVIVKGLPSNGGWVWVAATQGNAQNLNVSYPLIPNEGIGLFVKNTDTIWVMAQTALDGAVFAVEQE